MKFTYICHLSAVFTWRLLDCFVALIIQEIELILFWKICDRLWWGWRLGFYLGVTFPQLLFSGHPCWERYWRTVTGRQRVHRGEETLCGRVGSGNFCVTGTSIQEWRYCPCTCTVLMYWTIRNGLVLYTVIHSIIFNKCRYVQMVKIY